MLLLCDFVVVDKFSHPSRLAAMKCARRVVKHDRQMRMYAERSERRGSLQCEGGEWVKGWPERVSLWTRFYATLKPTSRFIKFIVPASFSWFTYKFAKKIKKCFSLCDSVFNIYTAICTHIIIILNLIFPLERKTNLKKILN